MKKIPLVIMFIYEEQQLYFFVSTFPIFWTVYIRIHMNIMATNRDICVTIVPKLKWLWWKKNTPLTHLRCRFRSLFFKLSFLFKDKIIMVWQWPANVAYKHYWKLVWTYMLLHNNILQYRRYFIIIIYATGPAKIYQRNGRVHAFAWVYKILDSIYILLILWVLRVNSIITCIKHYSYESRDWPVLRVMEKYSKLFNILEKESWKIR